MEAQAQPTSVRDLSRNLMTGRAETGPISGRPSRPARVPAAGACK